MAIPFSQTLESRHPDFIRLLMFSMVIVVPLALMWGWWFLTAPIPVYESSSQVHISDNTLTRTSFANSSGARRTQLLRSRDITAVFPEESLDRFSRQQQGYFFPKLTKEKQRGGILVTIVEIPRGFYRKTGKVTLQAQYPADQPDPFANLPLTGGQVRVAVDRITPAHLLARVSGLHNDQKKSGPVSYSRPQTDP
jgi:hypothetical protein